MWRGKNGSSRDDATRKEAKVSIGERLGGGKCVEEGLPA